MSSGMIKVCGLRRVEEVVACAAGGATALGFVFHAASPRATTPEAVAEMMAGAASGRAEGQAAPWRVGVFVDPPAERVVAAIRAAGLTHVQVHGARDHAAERAAVAAGAGLLRPVSVRGALAPGDFGAPEAPVPEAWLCDTHDPAQHGGTGRRFDVELIRPWVGRRPIWLAGGLDPENVGAAIAALPGLAGVDVSSGVEVTRGVKDLGRIAAFLAAARAAFAARG